MYTDILPVGQQWHEVFHRSLHSTVEPVCVTVYVVNTLSLSSLVKTPNQGLFSEEFPVNKQVFSH